jgi:predicted Zn-dependent protease
MMVLGALAAAGCAASAPGSSGAAAPISAREHALGREAAAEVERTTGLVRDPAVVGYVGEVGQRLTSTTAAPGVTWTFSVADDDEPNAFALPGGYVYVSRGLLSLLNSEDELAGVIGHEVGHVMARHAVRRVTAATPFAVLFGLPAAVLGVVSPGVGGVVAGAGTLVGGVVLAPYSREQEREADRLGMELAAKAGWEPGGLSSALRTLARASRLSGQDPARSSFFSTHPAIAERVEDTGRAAGALTKGSGVPMAGTRAAFLDRLDGLVVGPNPANGVFSGPRFLHPDLGFSWQVPDGWKTRNTPEAAGAAPGEGTAVVLLQMAGEGTDAAAGARADGLPDDAVRRLERLQIGGLPAAHVTTDSRGTRLDLTWIAHAGRVYRIAGVCRAADVERFRQAFTRSARSFQPIDDADRRRVQVARLRAHPARAGETLSALVERVRGAWNAQQAAVANGVEPDTRLDAGWPAKVPVRQTYATSRAGRRP